MTDVTAADAAPAAFPISITLDAGAGADAGELRPIWRFFGYDEPNYTYMRDGQRLLTELAALGPHTVYVRCHGLLCTGDGRPALKWGSTNAYTEGPHGNPVYDWTIVDRIFDAYRERGMRPYVQVGFMPEALSSRPQPYRHHWKPGDPYDAIYTGWAHPPTDYGKWRELCYQWVRHCVERHGADEVGRWYWQVWNEANIGYWQGTPAEFHKLHDFAADGIRRALPAARIGGPEVAGGGNAFMRAFLEHCLRGTNHATGKVGSPLDFLSFHAKGRPEFVDGHVRMGVRHHLGDIDRGFALVAEFPELRDKPIVIGESDPDGCAACPSTHYPQNGYRNGPLYAAYTAASFARKHDLAARHGVTLDGALTWAFEFEDQPYFAGHRVLATNGIALPVLNVFRMFGKMPGRRVRVTSSADPGLDAILAGGVRGAPDVSALASRGGRAVAVLLWHYHDDDVPGPAADVTVTLSGLGPGYRGAVRHYRVDHDHSNAHAAWQRMGSPQAPTPQQYAALEQAGQLEAINPPRPVVGDGHVHLRLTLPRQAVSLLVLETNAAG